MGKNIAIIFLTVLLLLSIAAIGYGVFKIIELNDKVDSMQAKIDEVEKEKKELSKEIEGLLEELSLAQAEEAENVTIKGEIHELMQITAGEVQATYYADALKAEEEQEYSDVSLVAAKFVESFMEEEIEYAKAVQGKGDDSNKVIITCTKSNEEMVVEMNIQNGSLIVKIGEWTKITGEE